MALPKVDLSHLSPNRREQIMAEMRQGQKRLQDHKASLQSARKVEEESTVSDVEEPNADEILAQQEKAREIAAEQADTQREIAARANAEKAARDYAQAAGAPEEESDDVLAEAEKLLAERRAQSKMLEPASIRGEGADEAALNNTAKEVADRLEARPADATYMGVTEAVNTTDDGLRYDAEGNPLQPAGELEKPVPPSPHPDAIRAEKNADVGSASTARQRAADKTKPAPAKAVGDGPKSE